MEILSFLRFFTHITVKVNITSTTISKVGAMALSVFFNNIKDSKGVNPADRLAAVENKSDTDVQRKFKGNISVSITGTVP